MSSGPKRRPLQASSTEVADELALTPPAFLRKELPQAGPIMRREGFKDGTLHLGTARAAERRKRPRPIAIGERPQPQCLANENAMWRQFEDLAQKLALARGPFRTLTGACEPLELRHIGCEGSQLILQRPAIVDSTSCSSR